MSCKNKILIIVLGICIFGILVGIGLKIATSEYRLGDFEYSMTGNGPMKSGVKSKTNVFDKSDVTLKLHYGFYEKNEYVFGYWQYPEDKVLVAMYIYDADCGHVITNDCEVEDYKNIDNYYFIKEISQEEMFSEEYAYSNKFMSGMTYEHSEFITIPEEFFKDDGGTVVIRFVSYIEPMEERDNYYSMHVIGIKLDYEMIKDGKVKITNLERK